MWDDDYLIGENPFIKSPLLFVEAFQHYLFPESASLHYRPIQNVSFALDYFFWNSNAYGYHLTNASLHAICGALLFFLLKRLLRRGRLLETNPRTASIGAFLVALLWSVHPIHSAAVDYISGRADSLAFLFASGAWILYLKASENVLRRSRLAYYTACLLCGLLALGSRETACIWLVIFLLHNVVFDNVASRRKKLSVVAGSFALLAAYAILRHLPEARLSLGPSQHFAPTMRAVLMLRALGDYGRLTIWPSKLYMERTVLDPENYRGTEQWANSVATEYLSILGLIVVAIMLWGAIRSGPARSLRRFGLAWFVAGFLPISNLFELNATVAEHWLYLPSIGLLLFGAGFALELHRPLRVALVPLVVIGACALSVRSYVRSTDWITPKTFFQRTMAAGGSSSRAALNLAQIYQKEGNYAQAEKVFRVLLQTTPGNLVARNQLAAVLYAEGKRKEAEALFASTNAAATEERKEAPRTWFAALNLAHIRHAEHDEAAALQLLDRARADYGSVWPLIRFESEILCENYGPEPAIGLVATFVRANWWHYEATVKLGELLAKRGDVEAAVEQLGEANWLDVNDPEAFRAIAKLRLAQGRFEEARAAQQHAIARQPDAVRERQFLADILLAMGRKVEAQATLARVAELRSIAGAATAN